MENRKSYDSNANDYTAWNRFRLAWRTSCVTIATTLSVCIYYFLFLFFLFNYLCWFPLRFFTCLSSFLVYLPFLLFSPPLPILIFLFFIFLSFFFFWVLISFTFISWLVLRILLFFYLSSYIHIFSSRSWMSLNDCLSSLLISSPLFLFQLFSN